MSLGFGETVQALTPDPKYFTLTNSNGTPATSYLGSVRQTLSFKVSGLGLNKVAFSGLYTDLLGVPTFAQVAYTGSYASLTGTPTLATVAISGQYSDLGGLPTLFNGAYTSLTGVPTFATVATTGRYSDLVGTPTFATVATSGLYSDLLGKPTLFNGAYSSLTGVPTFATVASSGRYADLSGTPTLATVATSGSYLDLSNRPSLFSGAYSSLTGIPTFATVATSGRYSDLSGLPNLFSGAYSALTGVPTFATVATSGSYLDLSNRPSLFSGAYSALTGTPTLATVATSGSYLDLSNRPSLFSGAYSALTGVPTFATVATSGRYSDLSGLPSLFNGAYSSLTGVPAFATVATSGKYSDLTGLPTLFNGTYASLTGTPTFATVATSGKYSDLVGLPTLFNGAYSSLTGAPALSTVATSGKYSDLTGTPSLATVATSGSYTDLINTPSGLTNTGSAGTGTWSLQVQTGSGKTSQVADIAFFSTFNNYPADKGQRRTADITAGFSSGVWGNEYLAFGVGSNDSQTLSVEKMRITGAGNVGIGCTPSYTLDVAGNIHAQGSLIVGGTGSWQAGSIYTDTNWGMLFRAYQASPAIAHYAWYDSSGTTQLLAINSAGNLTSNYRIYGYGGFTYTGASASGLNGMFIQNSQGGGGSYSSLTFGTPWSGNKSGLVQFNEAYGSSAQYRAGGLYIYNNNSGGQGDAGGVTVHAENASVYIASQGSTTMTVSGGNVNVKGTLDVSSTSPYAVPSGFMTSGSLTVGDRLIQYGGGSGWNTNTAGLLMETSGTTEVAVHHAGVRVASMCYYNGSGFTIGRDMGWGTNPLTVASTLTTNNPLWNISKVGMSSVAGTQYWNMTDAMRNAGGVVIGYTYYGSLGYYQYNSDMRGVQVYASGYYSISFVSFCDASDHRSGNLYITVNGGQRGRRTYGDTSIGYYYTDGFNCGIVTYLNANDIVGVYSDHIIHGNDNASFSGFMIG